MSNVLLSLIMDVFVLAGLGGTIYYAFRLSNALNGFRGHRQELRGLITELSDNIEKALQATEGLKNTSVSAGQELQKIIDKSKGLTEELQLMNDVGNSLAKRLENLAERNSRLVQGGNVDFPVEDDLESLFSGGRKEKSDDLLFSIQDREFEEDEMEEDLNWLDPYDEADEGVPEGLQSKAERDLYKALQKKQQRKTAGGGL